MTNVVRPVARVLAAELSGIEVDQVSGGADDTVQLRPNTDFYCGDNLDHYDGSHAD